MILERDLGVGYNFNGTERCYDVIKQRGSGIWLLIGFEFWCSHVPIVSLCEFLNLSKPESSHLQISDKDYLSMKWEKPPSTLSTEPQQMSVLSAVHIREESRVCIPWGWTWAQRKQSVCLWCLSYPVWSAHLSYSWLKLAILLKDFRGAHRKKDQPTHPSFQALFQLAALPYAVQWSTAFPLLPTGCLASGQNL